MQMLGDGVCTRFIFVCSFYGASVHPRLSQLLGLHRELGFKTHLAQLDPLPLGSSAQREE